MTPIESSRRSKVAARVLAATIVGLLLAVAAAAQATPNSASEEDPFRTEVFVAAGAAPGGDGSLKRPFATIEEGRDALRRVVRGRRVLTLLADLRVRNTIEFAPEDSGLEIGAGAGFYARPGKMIPMARVVGGVMLADPPLLEVIDGSVLERLPSDEARAAIRVIELPAGETWAGPVHRGMGAPVVPVGTEVFADEQPLIRARWPNEGFVRVGEVVDAGSVPRQRAADVPADQRETGPERGGVFRFAEPPAAERLARWAGAPDVWAFGYWHHDWADELLPVERIDPTSGTVKLGQPHRYGLKKGGTCYLTNLLEELDSPGEFFLDAEADRLYLWPPKPKIGELLLPTLAEPVFRIRGARNLTIRGLTIEGTRGPAIVAEKVEGLQLLDLIIHRTGSHGIVIDGKDCVVARCFLEAIGAAGVSLTGGDRPTLTPANNKLLLSCIRDFGRVYRTYQPAVGLSGVGQIVAGNELWHGPHSAIIFGGNDHLIERNEIFDVLRETGDCGAIYCGRDWTLHGNRIRHNFIHDLRGEEGRWQNAIYLDDMASGIAVTENLILRCHWGMLIGGGRDLEIAGNVFAECDLGIRFDARGVGWMAKHIADPETSTLHRRLAAMPVDRPPWSERFPSLQTYLSDRFGRPAGSRVVGNLFLATPLGSVVDREAVEVAGNQEWPDAPLWLSVSGGGPAGIPFLKGEYRGIPLAEIGRRHLVLAEHGTSEWTIVVPDEAQEVERDAARRLREFVTRMSGVELPMGRESEVLPPGRRILVGATRAAGWGRLDPGSLGEDGFRIRVVGDDLYLVGGIGLGIEYAVTELLERLGCRFWAPGALHVPESPALRLPGNLDTTQVPKAWFRHVNYGPALDPEYRRWHKLDRIQEEVGRLWAPRWVHSMFSHVPPERYFAEHPEYYALIGGERQATQLCLSNPDVLRITIESIRQMLAEHPDVRYISISQEDNYAHCQCSEARAINEREGSAMGETLHFVNAVADAFPDRIISTLAYQYTRKPPKHLRPRKNVSIMLCTIEEDRSRPIAESRGSTFPADFAGWSAICEDIFLWDYEVQFASPVSPFPNLRVLQPNVQWFVKNRARHLFLQGNGLHTEMAELRCYLLAKLAWNPDIDVAATTAAFLDGFYGVAGPFLGRYLDLIHDEMEASKQPLLIYGHPAQAMDTWLRPEVIDGAKVLFAQAEQAVAAEPVFAQRVRFARLPLIYAELEIAKRHGTGLRGIYRRIDRAGHWPLARWGVRPEIRQLLRTFLQGCEEAGIRRLREQDLTPEEYRAAWERLFDVSRLYQPAFGKAVTADPPPHPKYAGGDLARLTDGLPGGDRYTENWIGWEGCDAVFTLDLGEPRPLRQLRFSALQDPKSWIWLPREVDVAVSTDGETWHPAAILTHDRSERVSLIHDFTAALPERPIRYLRLAVDATETCPPWHHGAPGPSWFFLDELLVK